MLEKIVKYIPSNLRANKICRGAYWASINYIEIPLRGSFYSLRGWLYYVRYGYKLKKFKDIHKGQRCFIIGNGPSILQQDLTKLKDEIVFVVNWFALHEQYDEINPTYYCAVYPEAFPVGDTNIQFHRLLIEKTGNAVKFFSTFSVSPRRLDLYLGHQVFYLNCVKETHSMSLDITKKVHIGVTVISDFCLPLAFYMGFSEVYLLGCDCDLKLDKAPDSSKAHFHPPVDPFDKRYPPVDKSIPPEEDLRKWANSWRNSMVEFYSIAKETFERHDRKIYNAGVGGKLEVFERVNYDELF